MWQADGPSQARVRGKPARTGLGRRHRQHGQAGPPPRGRRAPRSPPFHRTGRHRAAVDSTCTPTWPDDRGKNFPVPAPASATALRAFRRRRFHSPEQLLQTVRRHPLKRAKPSPFQTAARSRHRMAAELTVSIEPMVPSAVWDSRSVPTLRTPGRPKARVPSRLIDP